MDSDLLRKTWAEVTARHGEAVPRWFYATLFLAAPYLRPLFGADMTEQRRKITAMLTLVVRGAHDLDTVVPVLQRLGRDHRRFRVGEDAYDAVGEALLSTLEHFLGDAWTPDVEATWTEAYGAVANAMIAAAREAARTEQPAWWDSQILFVELNPQRDRAYVVFQPPPGLPPGADLTIPVALEARPGTWMHVQPFPVDGGWAVYVPITDDPITLALSQAQPGDLLRLGQPSHPIDQLLEDS